MPVLVGAVLLSLFPPPARAILHDQGYICYVCHSLNPSDTRTGSNSIRRDQPILGSIPTKPGRTDRPIPGTGGYPLSCDMCHKSPTDVPTTKFASKARKHPVDLIQTGDNTTNPHEITCNDCHAGKSGGATPDNGDLVPQGLLAKGKELGYGYPDHLNTAPGYAHTLASNPPHLTQPYWSSTDNTAFWTAVRNNAQNMICWVCHDGTQQSPFTQVTANANVRVDYTGTGSAKGHAIRTAGGALGVGSALPCYDCHDSHGSVNNALVLDSLSIEGKSSLSLTSFNQASRPYNDLVVCAGCHDTGRAATVPGTRVEGLDPVDPYNSTATSSLHLPAVADDMLASTRNCLAANGGCHSGPHNPDVPCSTCHGPGGSGPTIVWPPGNATGKATPYGSHLSALRSDNLSAVADWNLQCNKCHDGHSGPVRVPTPPTSWSDPSGRLTGTDMAARLGLGIYAADGGVRLGGTATDNTSEADLCWKCHDAQTPSPVSEWGFNTKTTRAGFPVVWQTFTTQHDGTAEKFNYGHIYTDNSHTTVTSDWTAGYWMDEYDPLIRRRIASVHSASFDPAGQVSSAGANVDNAGRVNRTSPVLENRSHIRCSYCHDVHDLNLALGDTSSGKPFLRGSWVGNPYPPELPPRTAYYNAGGYTTRVNIDGAFTPRGLSTSRDRGGYFIDQNSGWPTNDNSMNTLAAVAGLCKLCHGTNVDTLKFYAGSTLWRAGMLNGHSNSTLGGTRVNRRDLFNATRYGYGMGMQAGAVGSWASVCGYYGGECDGNYPQSWNFNAYFSSGSGSGYPLIVNSGWYGGPAGSFVPQGGDYANWYADNAIGGAGAAGTMAHKFTCSKCHSPHATGLPVLLTHNCIDTRLAEAAPFNPANLIANNCHRKTSTADGWHNLAPGQ